MVHHASDLFSWFGHYSIHKVAGLMGHHKHDKCCQVNLAILLCACPVTAKTVLLEQMLCTPEYVQPIQ